jgi:DNA polymerase III delta subunit
MTKHIKLKADTMRNLGMIFFVAVAELFLQGCDPLAKGNIFIKSKEQLSANADDRIVEVTKVVELIAKQAGFTPMSTSYFTEKATLYMNKRNQDGIVTSLIVFSEDNIIKIYIKELGHRKLSEGALRLQDEIENALSPSIKDCCIIIKDNKYSGRKN